MMTRIAVVGCGYWGPNLIRNFSQNKSCELAMVCDKDTSRLESMKALYPSIQTTTDFQDVLDRDDIDAVAIATPARSHFSLIKQALRYGKHVLVEKPLAMSTEECEELIFFAGVQRRTLMVGHTFLYSPALIKVKELTTSESFGDLFYLYSHRVNLGRVQTDVNALWSIAPHDISIALFLVGQPPVEVSARGASYLNPGIEDVVFLTLTFPGGETAHIHVSWIDPSKTRKLTVVGSKRMITYDDLADEGKVKVYDKGVEKVSNEGRNGPKFGEFHYRLHSGDIYAPKIAMTEPLANEVGHFIECIQTGATPRTDGRNGLHVVQVMEAAQQSIQMEGAPIRLGSIKPRELHREQVLVGVA